MLRTVKKYFFILLIGVAIALLYYGPLIIYYHGKTLNPWQEYAYYGSQGKIIVIMQTLKSTFFNFQNLYQGVITILSLLGVLSLFAFKSERNLLIKLFFITGFLGIIHPFITETLIKTSFGYYGFITNFVILRSLFSFSGLFLIYKIKNEINYKRTVLLFVAIIVLIGFFIGINNFK
ncbi:MAG: hypothetical protein ACQXXF_07805, partial [Thermoplasmatota archaeon]